MHRPSPAAAALATTALAAGLAAELTPITAPPPQRLAVPTITKPKRRNRGDLPQPMHDRSGFCAAVRESQRAGMEFQQLRRRTSNRRCLRA